VAALAVDLRRRDEYDSSRADSPLRPAADAVVVDSTDLDREGVVDRVVELARSTVGAQR
jgi:cytidylate kinase